MKNMNKILQKLILKEKEREEIYFSGVVRKQNLKKKICEFSSSKVAIPGHQNTQVPDLMGSPSNRIVPRDAKLALKKSR